jgi:hypothetical protein
MFAVALVIYEGRPAQKKLGWSKNKSILLEIIPVEKFCR